MDHEQGTADKQKIIQKLYIKLWGVLYLSLFNIGFSYGIYIAHPFADVI